MKTKLKECAEKYAARSQLFCSLMSQLLLFYFLVSVLVARYPVILAVRRFDGKRATKTTSVGTQ